jgi:hypothetical protein
LVRIDATGGALGEVSSGLLAVGLHKGESAPQELVGAADPVLSNGDFSGKEGEGRIV